MMRIVETFQFESGYGELLTDDYGNIRFQGNTVCGEVAFSLSISDLLAVEHDCNEPGDCHAMQFLEEVGVEQIPAFCTN